MKALTTFTLQNAAAATGNGSVFEAQHGEDLITLMTVTAGSTNGITIIVESLNPDGTNWHQLATATYNADGAQAAIVISPFCGAQIRARISARTAGNITVKGYAARYGAD